MHNLKMGICSEKLIIRQSHHCVNVLTCTYTKPDSIYVCLYVVALPTSGVSASKAHLLQRVFAWGKHIDRITMYSSELLCYFGSSSMF